MVSITLSVPEETRKRMKQFPEINWSGLVRKTIDKKLEEFIWKENMLKGLKKEDDFTNWTVEMGRKMKEERLKELKKRKLI